MTSTFTLNFFLSGTFKHSWGTFSQNGLLTFGVFQVSRAKVTWIQFSIALNADLSDQNQLAVVKTSMQLLINCPSSCFAATVTLILCS